MSKKKYLKDSKGLVRAITTDTLQLEKPLTNENYDINVHNRNMDKIDKAIHDVKGSIDGLELTASNVTISDVDNKFTSTDVEGALKETIDKIEENKTNISNKVDIVVTKDRNIVRKDKTFYFIVTDEQSTGGSSSSGDIKVSPNMGIKIV